LPAPLFPYITFAVLERYPVFHRLLPVLAEEKISVPGRDLGAQAHEGISALFLGLLLIVAAPIAIFGGRWALRYLAERKHKRFVDDRLKEARSLEAAGRYTAAGLIYEKLKDIEKAVRLYERGGDYARAAAFYKELGQGTKACEMYELAGDIQNAVATRMAMGDFLEAARLYNQMGDKLKAAQAFEMSGNTMAAVRAFREAKDYISAARLLKELEMYREAADMYAISLAGRSPESSNIEGYYYYASLLEAAGDKDKCRKVLKDILAIDPNYLDVPEKLEGLGPEEGAHKGADKNRVANIDTNIDADIDTGVKAGFEESFAPPEMQAATKEDASVKATTLRSLMLSGRMEPRHSFRLWVQIMRSLSRLNTEGLLPGHLSPDGISIDAANNVSFSDDSSKDFSYLAPETVAGGGADQVSSIYSLGIILFELLTGSLDSVGIKKPGEVAGDVPSWLDEITLKCIDRDREKRYQGFNEIFATLKTLKSGM